jgi:glutaminyl-tRNA synthetase (EC 6.1.1.18)
MSDAEARPTNFIRQIIDKDLAEGKHTAIVTRSHRSRMGICTLAMLNQSV